MIQKWKRFGRNEKCLWQPRCLR